MDAALVALLAVAVVAVALLVVALVRSQSQVRALGTQQPAAAPTGLPAAPAAAAGGPDPALTAPDVGAPNPAIADAGAGASADPTDRPDPVGSDADDSDVGEPSNEPAPAPSPDTDTDNDNDTEPAAPTPPRAPVARGLLALEASRIERQWRQAAPGLEPPAVPADEPLDQLVRALAMELDLLRDDVGVPGSLTVSLEDDLDEGTALVLLRVVQELLSTVAHAAESVDLSLVGGADLVTVSVRYESDAAIPATVGADDEVSGSVAVSEPGLITLRLPGTRPGV